jgi:hypothetical protein
MRKGASIVAVLAVAANLAIAQAAGKKRKRPD